MTLPTLTVCVFQDSPGPIVRSTPRPTGQPEWSDNRDGSYLQSTSSSVAWKRWQRGWQQHVVVDLGKNNEKGDLMMKRLILLGGTIAALLGAASSAQAAQYYTGLAVQNSSCTATGFLEANQVDASTNDWSINANTGGIVRSACPNTYYKVQVNCTFRQPDGSITTRSVALNEGNFQWNGTDTYAQARVPAPGSSLYCAGAGGTRARLIRITGIHWARNGGTAFGGSVVTEITIP